MHPKQTRLSLMILMLSYMSFADAACCTTPCCTSHQFIPRQITTDLSYTNMLNYYERHHNNHNKFIYSGNFIYQQSNKSTTLGTALYADNDCSFRTAWFGWGVKPGDTPIGGSICTTPQRKTFAYYNYAYADLSDLLCGLWADLGFAVLKVNHNLHQSQQQTGPATLCPAIETLSDAFNNPAFKYSKGSPCAEHRAGVDDIQLRIGYERSWCNDTHMWGLYFISTLPTGQRPNMKSAFEPLVGSRHGSVGAGFNADYELWCENDYKLAVLFDANYRYAFRRDVCRSFDLCKNGVESRYLLVATKDDPETPMPGINFFTQNVTVIPRSTAQVWLALHYERCNYDFELGYNLFWRQQEKVQPPKCFPTDLGIFDLGGVPGMRTTASMARVVVNPGDPFPVSDPSFVVLTTNDLNLASGAGDKVLTNKFYGIASTNGCTSDCMDWHLGLGTSYEFATNRWACSALSYWAVFGQFSLLF